MALRCGPSGTSCLTYCLWYVANHNGSPDTFGLRRRGRGVRCGLVRAASSERSPRAGATFLQTGPTADIAGSGREVAPLPRMAFRPSAMSPPRDCQRSPRAISRPTFQDAALPELYTRRLVLLDEEVVSASSAKTIHRIVARKDIAASISECRWPGLGSTHPTKGSWKFALAGRSAIVTGGSKDRAGVATRFAQSGAGRCNQHADARYSTPQPGASERPGGASSQPRGRREPGRRQPL